MKELVGKVSKNEGGPYSNADSDDEQRAVFSKNRRELLEALADFEDEHFMQRAKRVSDKDDIILFKVEKNAARAVIRRRSTANGISKSLGRLE